MKQVIIIILTFVLAFLTSILFELDFIQANNVRYVLTTLLIAIELCVGFYLVKSEVK